ncbi:tryptophan 2,3-dioxygenase family protein [Plantactinospora siamensis]|uniref:Tryptophan 2,3-dioxygenase family protein n=1 Tax=Plantactinospora siamensis TaxID=555372 RepID=A0ABV6P4E6_9ACTN
MSAVRSYDEYVGLDALLGAARPVAAGGSPEVSAAERFFIVCHQTSELWLSQAHRDLRLAADLVDRRDLDRALPPIRRAKTVLGLIIATARDMAQLSRAHFDAFRPALAGTSGAQSAQFTLLLKGMDNPYVFQLSSRLQDCDPREVRRDRLVQVWDELDEFLARAEEWRRLHIELARHFVGGRRGTGGTSGVAYLEGRANALAVG